MTKLAIGKSSNRFISYLVREVEFTTDSSLEINLSKLIIFMFTRYILNIIGETVRWIVGSLWRTIFNKPKFTYKEYIYMGQNNQRITTMNMDIVLITLSLALYAF